MTYRARKNPFSGRDAASAKYGLIAALNTAAFADSGIPKDLAHRLTTAIVARLDWARNELSVGHAQFAQMWSCDLRRVKRILAQLKGRGLLSVKSPGVRGRVTVYSLCIDRIVEITRPYWRRLGADFEHRLNQLFPPGDGEGSLWTGSDTDGPDPSSRKAAVNAPESATSGRNTVEDPAPCSSPPAADDRQIKQPLERDVGQAAFMRWVQPLKLQLEGSRLTVVARSSFVAGYVERIYGDRICEVARRLRPGIENVRFTA